LRVAGSRRGGLWSIAVSAWAPTSFENDAANDWFYAVEEAVDPGATIASALDHALGEADYLDLAPSCEAIRGRRIVCLLCRPSARTPS
jgi:hypothetical protein